jgi:hypothetical protein
VSGVGLDERLGIELLNEQDQVKLVRISHDGNDPTEAQNVEKENNTSSYRADDFHDLSLTFSDFIDTF